MAALAVASWRVAVMGRWTARILGTLMVLLFLALLVGEGMPAVSQLTASEKLSFLGMAGLTVGLLLAWKWEGLGGMVSVAGFALLVAIGREHLRMWAFRLPALPNALRESNSPCCSPRPAKTWPERWFCGGSRCG